MTIFFSKWQALAAYEGWFTKSPQQYSKHLHTARRVFHFTEKTLQQPKMNFFGVTMPLWHSGAGRADPNLTDFKGLSLSTEEQGSGSVPEAHWVRSVGFRN